MAAAKKQQAKAESDQQPQMINNAPPSRRTAAPTQRQEITSLGEIATVQRGEMMAEAIQAAMVAEVKARYSLAIARPREMPRVRDKLLAECEDRDFAEESQYALPRKKWDQKKKRFEETFIIGWSIRFVEAALRAWGNTYTRTDLVYESDDQRVLNVTTMDLEANNTYSRTVVVPKTQERKRLREDQVAVGQRRNSFGDVVHIVRSTPEEMQQQQQSQVSRAIRSEALRFIPAGLLSECETVVQETIDSSAATEERRKKMLGAMKSVGISQEDIEKHLGHRIESTTSAEFRRLLGIYQAIRDGTTTWKEVLTGGVTEGGPADDDEAAAASAEAAQKPAEKSPRDLLLEQMAGRTGELKIGANELRQLAAENAIAIPEGGVVAMELPDLQALDAALAKEIEARKTKT